MIQELSSKEYPPKNNSYYFIKISPEEFQMTDNSSKNNI